MCTNGDIYCVLPNVNNIKSLFTFLTVNSTKMTLSCSRARHQGKHIEYVVVLDLALRCTVFLFEKNICFFASNIYIYICCLFCRRSCHLVHNFLRQLRMFCGCRLYEFKFLSTTVVCIWKINFHFISSIACSSLDGTDLKLASTQNN